MKKENVRLSASICVALVCVRKGVEAVLQGEVIPIETAVRAFAPIEQDDFPELVRHVKVHMRLFLRRGETDIAGFSDFREVNAWVPVVHTAEGWVPPCIPAYRMWIRVGQAEPVSIVFGAGGLGRHQITSVYYPHIECGTPSSEVDLIP